MTRRMSGRSKIRMGMGHHSHRASFLVFVGSLLFLLASVGVVEGFFIDLESLGFKTSEDDGGSVRDDSTGESSSLLSKLLVAAPTTSTESSQVFEVESKDDPNKSIKLTLAELKQLVLGTVKDLTPRSPPINIKITGGSVKKEKNKTTSSTTTTTPKPKKKKQKQQVKHQDSYVDAYTKSANYYNRKKPSSYNYETYDYDAESDVRSSLWNRIPSTSMMLPPFKEIGGHRDLISITNDEESEGIDTYDGDSDNGVFSMAKAVLSGPSKMVSKWRSNSIIGGKNKKHPRRPPAIPDIIYNSKTKLDRRRRRNKKNGRPSFLQGRRRLRPSITGHRRRGHHGTSTSYSYSKKQRLPTEELYDDYNSSPDYPSSHYFMYENGEMKRRLGYDSTIPRDDSFSLRAPDR